MVFLRLGKAAYLKQLGLQVESLMERHLLEGLSESWEVHKHCTHLDRKQLYEAATQTLTFSDAMLPKMHKVIFRIGEKKLHQDVETNDQEVKRQLKYWELNCV